MHRRRFVVTLALFAWQRGYVMSRPSRPWTYFDGTGERAVR